MLRNTTKPIITTATTLEDLHRIHRLASAAAGGAEELRRKPFYIFYAEPISPLRVERSVAERVLFCAEHEIPMLFAAGANLGASAPVTPEGGVVQGGAESLAGLVLAFLKNPRVRFIYGANNTAADMRTSIVCYGSPEWPRTVAVYADLGRFYDLPTFGTAGCSDAHRIDAQAGLEAYESILMAVRSGPTLVHDVGYLAYGALWDARMLVLTDMMIRRARHVLRPLDLSPNALAEDAIDQVAREDSLYVAHEHTRANFRQALWLAPKFINRRRLDSYGTEKEMNDLLGEEVRRIEAAHRPMPLEEDKARRIEALLR
jgi:trimethylamine--corrinoid protein Co-methyltransferase